MHEVLRLSIIGKDGETLRENNMKELSIMERRDIGL